MSRAPVTLRVPPSKSLTHRLLLLAGRADGPCELEDPLWGADCRATAGALAALGVRIERLSARRVRVTPPARWRASAGPLDCANSGTTLRLLAALLADQPFPSALDGDASLRRRPSGPLWQALEALGAEVEPMDAAGRCPVRVRGPLRAGAVRLGPRVSSQFASGLALALALGPGGSVTLEPPVDSAPYLALTAQAARTFGVALALETTAAGGWRLHTPGGQRPRAGRYAVEADWSTAAFGLVGGALLGRSVILQGLDDQSAQGDRAVLQHLRAFGLDPRFEGPDLRLDPAPLRGAGSLDLGATPDLFPALCALAARAEGPTVLAGAPALRLKESDRIAAMAAALGALGVSCEPRPDGLAIAGRPAGPPVSGWPAHLESHGDHRIHMALALLVAALAQAPEANLGAGSVSVSAPECVAVSHPGFDEDLERLRGV